MNFLALFGMTILGIGILYVRSRVITSRLARLSWNDLLAKLEPVPTSGIATIALDYLQPDKDQLQIGTAELWVMIGEAEGIRRMYANAQILLALAGYAQRWNPVESAVVAERMRRDGVTLRRAALKLYFGFLIGTGTVRGPFNVQEVASAYYLMRRRLLALYETSHAGRYPSLAAAL